MDRFKHVHYWAHNPISIKHMSFWFQCVQIIVVYGHNIIQPSLYFGWGQE